MAKNIHDHRILILDFGSQYTQLIARRVREIGVYCEIRPFDLTPSKPASSRLVALSWPVARSRSRSSAVPGPRKGSFHWGFRCLASATACRPWRKSWGRVEACDKREFGYAQVRVTEDSTLLHDISDHITEGGDRLLDVWMSHGDQVMAIPEGFQVLAGTGSAPIAAMQDESRGFYGVQFHPEVTHTLQGQRIPSRFVLDVCGCEALWTPSEIVEDAVEQIRAQVGSDKVLLGLSGGVDSSVTAALLHRAIGDQLTCVFVDNGLLRLNEGKQVMDMFARNMGVNVIHHNAEDRFLDLLKGIEDPEEKRRIIGNTFIDVFDEEAATIQDVNWLAQGTIYPDVVESAKSRSGKATVIKSHHNVGGLPEKMKLSLVEPLRELFKDEVRRIGLELGLPYDMVYRHPFPGPGLGYAYSARCARNTRTCFARRTRSFWKSCITTTGITEQVRHSRFSCR